MENSIDRSNGHDPLQNGQEIKTTLKNSNGEKKNSSTVPYVLRNLSDGTETVDLLYLSAEPSECTPLRCIGSIMFPSEKSGQKSFNSIVKEATDFFKQYFKSLKSENSDLHKERLSHVLHQIETCGTYHMEENELIFGAHLAWRNSARCSGRIHWRKLQVFDCRYVTTVTEMFQCCLKHIKFGTNNGKLRSSITIFPTRTRGVDKDFRVWNDQLIRYAGYRQSDGSIIGDPATVEFTELCEKLGWSGKGTAFDVLPLVLQANGEPPQLFDIPKEYILEVDITHPHYTQLKSLNLKWYALPVVSNMCLDVGGLEFTAAPFNGWYMATEIGGRDLADKNRYNLLKPVAELIGIDTSNNGTMWRDHAMVALTYATYHSFMDSGVTIVDHHTNSDSFMKHLKGENKLRGGCPADWAWIVPPLSGAATDVFHQEMLNYKLKPSFEYQESPVKNYAARENSNGKKMSFRDVAKAVKLSTSLMGGVWVKRQKVTILYATETGKSESFAKRLNDLFSYQFGSKVLCMDEYNFSDIRNDQCILVIASTSGNGEAPDNGQSFLKNLEDMSSRFQKSSESEYVLYPLSCMKTLPNLRYSVFALGSRAYPNFCSFGKAINKLFRNLGGEEIFPIGEGDELNRQDDTFYAWASDCFQATCQLFCLSDVSVPEDWLNQNTKALNENLFEIIKVNAESMKEEDLGRNLSVVHKKDVKMAIVKSVSNLQHPDSGRVTDLVCLHVEESEDLNYWPGDHICIYPQNDRTMVKELLESLICDLDFDESINICKKKTDNFTCTTIEKIPMPSTLRKIFTVFLDITTPPTRKLLSAFADHCSDENEKKQLIELATNTDMYEDWKFKQYRSILEVLQIFTSVKIHPTILIYHLPVLKSRTYSISSSPKMYPNEVHITIARVSYTINDTQHFGVCSSWLHSLTPGGKVPYHLKRAFKFHLPEDPSVPIIMIGPGTGIAPFRSFWQQLMYEKQTTVAQRNAILFFGCRNSNQDNIYQQERNQAIAQGGLSQMFNAFSREQDQPKVYVQHLLKENVALVGQLLVVEKGHLYVCGDVRMANDVGKALQDMLQEFYALSDEEILSYINQMKSENRYHVDVFGVTLKHKEITSQIRTAAFRGRNSFRKNNKPKKE